MIQKTIHFIWIGPQPKYVNASIRSYKETNPQFAINYVHYLQNALEDLYFKKKLNSDIDELIFRLLESIFNKSKYQKLILRQISFFKQFGTIPFLQMFCDILRLELLNAFGGIYVDCDTFSIRPFDDKLLKLDNFCVYDKIGSFCEINNYFIGSNRTYIDNYFDNLTPLYQTNNFMIKRHFNRPLDFQIRKIKFFAGKLDHSDFTNKYNGNYIEHYSDFTWGRKKVQFTKFDKLFNDVYS